MDVSFSADQLRRVLGSAEGKQLLALLAAGAGDPAAGLTDGAGAGAAAKARWMSSSARCAPYWTTLRSCRSCGRSQARSASVSRMRPRRRKPLCRACRPRLRLPRSRRSRRCRRPFPCRSLQPPCCGRRERQIKNRRLCFWPSSHFCARTGSRKSTGRCRPRGLPASLPSRSKTGAAAPGQRRRHDV